MASELETIQGFHKVNNVKARELLQPYINSDGYYLLRPSSDSKGGVLCTICVTNRSKLMNYRLVQESGTGRFYIHSHTSFPAIHLLLAHYRTTPINSEANTRLLTPVGAKPEQPVSEGEDAYVIMERQTMSPTRSASTTPTTASGGTGNDIPGLYTFLPKSEINVVMGPYMVTNGYYLLRPSSTSEGQLTLAVSHNRQVLNFKINFDKGQYYISPKKRLPSVRDLLSHYASHPIHSKKAKNEKIFLLYPIPVDQEKEKLYQEIQQEKAAAREANVSSSNNALAPGWTEHWHTTYNRTYYYNVETGQSVWEKPLMPTPTRQAPPLPDKSPRPRMKDRPLPSVPGMISEEPQTNTNTVGRRSSKKFSRQQEPLPATPSYSNTLPSRSRKASMERELPPLPPKEDTPSRRDLPPLPPKEDSGGLRGGNTAPGISNRPPRPIPGQGSQETVKKSLPPLPPKEDIPPPLKNKRPPPKPATKNIPNGHPSVPSQKNDKALPPLPPKAEEETTPVVVQERPKRKKIVEYEDFVPLHQAGPPKKIPSKSSLPPPLPEKEVPAAPSVGGGPPPPPPPPAIGAPPPPPLPPAASPQVGLKTRAATMSTPSPQSSSGSGRPFTAGDLASQRTMLKKRANSESEEPKKEALTGIASVFATAIDTRRKAMVDSDSESDFEDVDDDEDWDD